MNQGIRFRLVLFFTAITLLAALISWTAHTAWRRMGGLQAYLSAQQWKSFQTADHLQQTLLSLNNMMLRYAAYRDDDDWTNFTVTSAALDRWMDAQLPVVPTKDERPLIRQIKAGFTNYVAAAMTIHERIYGTHQSLIRVVEFTDFEKQSKGVLALSFQLAQVHQESLDAYQAQTANSLGVLRWILLGALVLLLAAGVWLAVVVYHGMIRPLQLQLVESRQLVERQEKLASLGLLAAGVAHEIRNPLTAIKAWLYLQQKHLARGTPEFDEAQLIGSEIDRLERIVRDFLQFARPSEPQWLVVAVEQPLREVWTLMQPDLEKKQIKLVLADIAPVQIRIDPQQIKQVLINLVQNAADSIGEKGTVTLRALRGEKWLHDRLTEVVILEVADTGKGIPPEAEKRLFDPFFTTKDFGTGLGLPISARIVEKHQGAIQYQTQANRGTTFGIILPRHK